MTEALGRLAARFGLEDRAVAQLETLLDALVDDPLAPTAVRARAKALDDHLADSLVALEVPEIRAAGAIADIGSGAGLPGLVLAIALPAARVVLIESAARKCAFLERTVTACELDNVRVVNRRAEEVREEFDVVTVRAVASLAVVAEYAAPLLRLGGTLVAWRGERDRVAEVEAEAAATALGLAVDDIRHVVPYPGAINRHLHLMSKLRDTPDRFPRRPGVATKRPLGRGAA